MLTTEEIDERIDQLLGPDSFKGPSVDRVAVSQRYKQRLVDLGLPVCAVSVEEDGSVRLRFNQRDFEKMLNRFEDAPQVEEQQIHQNTSLF